MECLRPSKSAFSSVPFIFRIRAIRDACYSLHLDERRRMIMDVVVGKISTFSQMETFRQNFG